VATGVKVNAATQDASKMQRMQWTPEQKAEALGLLAVVGKAEASRRTGIPAGTIASWGVRGGVSAPSPDELRALHEGRVLTVALRKAALADQMLVEAARILGQLHEPMVEKKALVVSDGAREGSHVEVATVYYDRPTTADQKRIVETVAVLVDKLQLLTGEATARLETMDGTEQAEAERRERAAGIIDQLAERRRSA